MELEEIKLILKEFIEEFNGLAIEKLADKLYRVHRGNTVQIIRSWRDELDRIKFKPKELLSDINKVLQEDS